MRATSSSLVGLALERVRERTRTALWHATTSRADRDDVTRETHEIAVFEAELLGEPVEDVRRWILVRHARASAGTSEISRRICNRAERQALHRPRSVQRFGELVVVVGHCDGLPRRPASVYTWVDIVSHS